MVDVKCLKCETVKSVDSLREKGEVCGFVFYSGECDECEGGITKGSCNYFVRVGSDYWDLDMLEFVKRGRAVSDSLRRGESCYNCGGLVAEIDPVSDEWSCAFCGFPIRSY